MLPLLDICSPGAREFENHPECHGDLLAALSGLSDADLSALEDDLDLYAFTGLRSRQIARYLSLCSV